MVVSLVRIIDWIAIYVRDYIPALIWNGEFCSIKFIERSWSAKLTEYGISWCNDVLFFIFIQVIHESGRNEFACYAFSFLEGNGAHVRVRLYGYVRQGISVYSLCESSCATVGNYGCWTDSFRTPQVSLLRQRQPNVTTLAIIKFFAYITWVNSQARNGMRIKLNVLHYVLFIIQSSLQYIIFFK